MQVQQSRSKTPLPKPQDIEYLLARGNVLLANRLMQRMAIADYATAKRAALVELKQPFVPLMTPARLALAK